MNPTRNANTKRRTTIARLALPLLAAGLALSAVAPTAAAESGCAPTDDPFLPTITCTLEACLDGNGEAVRVDITTMPRVSQYNC